MLESKILQILLAPKALQPMIQKVRDRNEGSTVELNLKCEIQQLVQVLTGKILKNGASIGSCRLTDISSGGGLGSNRALSQ